MGRDTASKRSDMTKLRRNTSVIVLSFVYRKRTQRTVQLPVNSYQNMSYSLVTDTYIVQLVWPTPEQ